MKRCILQGLLASFILHALVIAGAAGWSYYQALRYVPRTVQAYESVDILQRQTSFGVMVSNQTWGLGVTFILLAALYAGVRYWRLRRSG
ncbi:hypothetical protein [Paenibacillus sp. y28]|uniref:hypothetical protein n=1 Tax=Paenibacillus sp. y28 TaxID=3129110 RepID=UPI003019D294